MNLSGNDANPSVPAIDVCDFHKVYDGTHAVKGMTFQLPAGTVGALLGPNGAGKTTTIRTLSGIIRPTSGNLRVAGFDVVQQPLKVKQRVAYVPDDPPLFESLTVWEHLRFVATAYTISNFEEAAEQLLTEFELQPKRDAMASELSRGMRQKVAIACAYLHRPDVLFFDEPLTGLDPAAIRQLKRSMVDRANEGATILVSSHLLALVEDICRHLIVIRSGQCLFAGKMSELEEANPDLDSLEEIFFRLTGGSN